MAEFNLIDESWIPCISRQGGSVEYGIRDVLLKAHDLREVCDGSPLVTAAIHRLLLAILYRAHNGPRDFNAWSKLYTSGAFDAEIISGYLSRWKDRFYLIEAIYPFFQIAQLETKKAVSITRLATECASGNNATLFDHSSDGGESEWLFAQTARRLIACQAFALGFGKSGDAKIRGKEESLPYSADGIALRGVSVWLQGENLFDTLTVNLHPTDDASLPPWELDDPHEFRDRLAGKGRRAVTSFGIVDRYTWQSRLVRILAVNGASSRMYFTQGRSADKSPGDPMKVYRASKGQGVSALPLSSGKAAWRDAHTIFMIPAAGGNEQRPECFNLVARARQTGRIPPGRQFITNVVGLASAPNKAGKFLLWRHERMPVPAEMLSDSNLIERLGLLLENAEQAAREQRYRIRRIARFYRIPSGRKPTKKELEDIDKIVAKIDPRPVYWARMEKHFFGLLEDLPKDWDHQADDWEPLDQQVATQEWRKNIKREARRALQESIKSIGTSARAIQAIARVRLEINDDDLTPQPLKKGKESRRPKGGEKK